MPRRRTKKPTAKIRLTLDVEPEFYEELALAALLERTPKAKLMRKAIALYIAQVKVEGRSNR